MFGGGVLLQFLGLQPNDVTLQQCIMGGVGQSTAQVSQQRINAELLIGPNIKTTNLSRGQSDPQGERRVSVERDR